MTPEDLEELHRRLTGELAEGGHFQQEWQREVHARVPRHRFAPDTLWEWDEPGARWSPLSRTDEPGRWSRRVYCLEAAVTLVEEGVPVSSMSSPPAVWNMLASLDPRPGDRVLEIGTGTGYHTALLCERVGARGGVTSVEVHGELLDRARGRLREYGYRPRLVLGDGAAHRAGGPYDRLISTASVRRVPGSWTEQVRPGGEIVTPWLPNFAGYGLMWLRVEGPGRARGWFHGTESFMPLRSHRSPRPDLAAAWRRDADGARNRPVGFDAAALDAHARFALTVRLPGVGWYRSSGGGWLLSTDDARSWARIEGADGWCGGPRDLLAEAAAALRWWRDRGQPPLYDFGISVADGRQWVWWGEERDTAAELG